jgi:hypothetical protein
LVDGCREHGIRQAFACVADSDQVKLDCLRDGGFGETARLPVALYLSETYHDVLIFSRAL